MVAIYLITRAYDLWCWLCPKHVAARTNEGWTVKQRKEPPHELACEDCPKRKRSDQ
jgi:hypothetical protein